MLFKKISNKYAFIFPAAVIYLGVIVIPAFYSLYLSFFKWNGVAPVKRFVFLKNYVNLFLHDSTFVRAALNNVIWVLLVMTLTVGVSLSLALLLNRQFKGRALFRGVFYFPYVLSGVMVAITWTWVYHPQLGLLSGFFDMLGFEGTYKTPLAGLNSAFYAVFLAALWQGFGAPMILFLSGLSSIPKELYEAADMDGASKLQSLFYITIPMLKETFVIVFAIQIISAVKVYDVVIAMTMGGPANRTHTMATWMVQQTFIFAKVGTGTAIAVIMVLVLMVVIIPFVLYMARD